MASRLFTEDEMLSAITACIRAERLRAGEFERELERVRPQLEHQARSFDRIKELLPPQQSGGDGQ